MKILLLLLSIMFVAGCNSASHTDTLPSDSAESLYPVGTSRAEMETRRGPSKFIWVGDSTPDDDFAAGTMREMISLGKPRPRAYQVYLTRRLDVPNGYYRDYLFYNDANRVFYVARSTK